MAPTAAVEATRAQEMFVIGSSWPTASKVGASATKPTKGLVLFVHKAVTAWDDAHVAALSASFGNFDRVVARGWLLADALGLPLLERHEAFALGGRVKHHGAKLDAKIEADRRAARKRAAKESGEAQQALEEAAEEAEAALLREEVQMKLPEAQPTLGGKRKRVEEAEEAEEARPTLIELRQAVTAAEVAVQSAEEVARADEARVERATRRSDALVETLVDVAGRIRDACDKQQEDAKKVHDAACERAEQRGEERPPTPYEATYDWSRAESKRLKYEQWEVPFMAAEAAVEAAQAEAEPSEAAAKAAHKALSECRWAVLHEEARVQDAAVLELRASEAAERSGMQRGLDVADGLIAALMKENELLSERLRMVTPFLPLLREVEQFELDPQTGERRNVKRWCELVPTPAEEEEEPWDEETAARAQAEMLAAHRATPAAGRSAP